MSNVGGYSAIAACPASSPGGFVGSGACVSESIPIDPVPEWSVASGVFSSSKIKETLAKSVSGVCESTTVPRSVMFCV